MKLALVFGMKMFKGYPLRSMVDIARAADELGFEYLALAEHVLMHANGAEMHPADELMPEPLTTLAAFASVTQRIGLMTGILIAPLRPAGLLAKQVATLDALAGGKRVVLGVSTSWQEAEYAALNVPFADRGRILNETLEACRALWARAPASFASESVSFTDMYCEPRPEHVDDVKIWFGGKFTPRLVRRVVELGHGWIPFQGYGESLEEIGGKVRVLRAAMRDAGRDPGTLDVAYWMRTRGRTLEQVLEDIPRMAENGVTVGEFLFAPYAESPRGVPSFLEKLARARERAYSAGTGSFTSKGERQKR
jgi:probable F420-dependent oxidoreductase